MNIYTIGFTKKSARTFFELLRRSGAARVVDIRLNNVSQLAGFAKRDDLKYFLTELCDMEYSHNLALAPTKTMLDTYKKHGSSWLEYEDAFLDLMAARRVEDVVSPSTLDNAVLLCSEAAADHCHRRLVAEYLSLHWDNVSITHL